MNDMLSLMRPRLALATSNPVEVDLRAVRLHWHYYAVLHKAEAFKICSFADFGEYVVNAAIARLLQKRRDRLALLFGEPLNE